MTPNETANVTPNETANVMHMNSSLVAKFGNRPARSHRNPKLWILTKLDPSECIKTPKANLTPLLGPLCNVLDIQDNLLCYGQLRTI